MGAAVIVDAAVHRGRKFTEVENWLLEFVRSVLFFELPWGPKSRLATASRSPEPALCDPPPGCSGVWPPTSGWFSANPQLKLWRFGIGYPNTRRDRLWLIGKLPWGTAILPWLQMSQCLCTFLGQGQRETCSLTGYRSDGGIRQDRCGKSSVCVPSMQPFRIKLFLQKQSRSSRVQPSRNVCCHAQHIIFKSQQQDIHNCRASLFQRVATSI